MIRQTEVIVGTQVQHPLTIHLQPGSLRAGERPNVVIQALILQAAKFGFDPGEFGGHDNDPSTIHSLRLMLPKVPGSANIRPPIRFIRIKPIFHETNEVLRDR
jgi:hypothetical protein